MGNANPKIAGSLTEIYDGLNRSMADMAEQNYGLAKQTVSDQLKRLEKAIEYFGGSVK